MYRNKYLKNKNSDLHNHTVLLCWRNNSYSKMYFPNDHSHFLRHSVFSGSWCHVSLQHCSLSPPRQDRSDSNSTPDPFNRKGFVQAHTAIPARYPLPHGSPHPSRSAIILSFIKLGRDARTNTAARPKYVRVCAAQSCSFFIPRFQNKNLIYNYFLIISYKRVGQKKNKTPTCTQEAVR